MGKRISPSNAVGNAVEQACLLYGVPCYRMNSRVLTVAVKGGKERPMFFGSWTDRFGVKHRSGMADYLLTPSVTLSVIKTDWAASDGLLPKIRVVVPLWIECKSGRGTLEPEQMAFKDDVQAVGSKYLMCHDNADVLVAWFEMMQVRKGE